MLLKELGPVIALRIWARCLFMRDNCLNIGAIDLATSQCLDLVLTREALWFCFIVYTCSSLKNKLNRFVSETGINEFRNATWHFGKRGVEVSSCQRSQRMIA